MDRLYEILRKKEHKEDRLLNILKLNKQKPKKSFFKKIANFFTNEKTPNKTFEYVLNGKKKSLEVYIPSKIYDSSFNKAMSNSYLGGNHNHFYHQLINSGYQKQKLSGLVKSLQKQTSNKETQARIAISLVQHIPYGNGFIFFRNKSPFEVASSNKGVCGGKSFLLSFLLKELGFGNAIFSYSKLDKDPLTKKTRKFNHANVGVKCSSEYQYEGSGYAVIETTQPKIISDYTWNDYSLKERKIWGRRLPKAFSLVKISDGSSIDISEEYYDAQELIRLETIAEEQSLSAKNQRQLIDLYNKYHLNNKTF